MTFPRVCLVAASVSLAILAVSSQEVLAVPPQKSVAAPANAGAASKIPAAPRPVAALRPTAALRRALIPRHGVRISETSKVWTGESSSNPASTFHVKGILEFGARSVVAGHILRVTASGKKFRFRVARGVTYGAGGAWSNMLPAGKKWAISSSLRLKPYQLSEQNINVFEPATLHAVLMTRGAPTPGQMVNGVRTTRYSGVISAKALCAVSPSCREKFGRSNDFPIHWHIWLDARGHILRLHTKWTQEQSRPGGGSEVSTHYAGWGSRVKIRAPFPSQVARVS